MAARCIDALNELDVISEKIFYKYSKTRLKAEVEGKVRESKSRAERNVSSQQEKCTSRRNSYLSSNSSRAVTKKSSGSYSKVHAAKSASSTKTQKHTHNSNKRVKTSTDCHTKVNKVNLSIPALPNNDDDSIARDMQTPSIFGKHTPGAPKYKPGTWFNFENGVHQGAIDSFACDDLKEKALCYKVDLTESKPVPKLLHHRLEVRIGRNGKVRNEDSGMKQSPSNQDTSNNKIRPSPLSWEEQLNWKNTRVIAPRETPPKKDEDQGLCETHPVIFHPEAKTRVSNTTNISNEATAAYRMYLDRRLLTSDRRNLTCGGKCITSVELQDATDEVGTRQKAQETLPRTKSQESDFDKMDMSTTIQNIEQMYRTGSVESAKNMPLDRGLMENPNLVDTPTEFEKTSPVDAGMEKEFEKVKMNKRVSFMDEIDAIELCNTTKIEELTFEEMDSSKDTIKPSIIRPRSSRDRLQSNAAQELLSLKVEKPRRPYTAPPCSPRMARDVDDAIFKKQPSQMLPIHVPTSEREVLSETEENENKLDKPDEQLNSEEIEKHLDLQNGDENTCNESSDTINNIRVMYTCKSAPALRVTPKQDETISRSQSTINSSNKTNKYIPPKPVAVLSDSTMELPSNVPPAQALIELRKRIRENLAKETADLQLDIQQLYIKHHSNLQ